MGQGPAVDGAPLFFMVLNWKTITPFFKNIHLKA